MGYLKDSEDSWLKKFYMNARAARPYVTSGLPQQSRRIEGQITFDGEANAYKDVVIYIEEGLGGYSSILDKLLMSIWQFQGGDIDQYYVYCFAFGYPDKELKHRGRPITIRRDVDSTTPARILAELSGPEEPSGKSYIHQLFPFSDPYGRKTSLEADDLIVFVCRNADSFSLTKLVQDRLQRLARHRRMFWIYVNEGEPVVETGFSAKK